MKKSVGQIERLTQNRVVRFFQETLGYHYLATSAHSNKIVSLESILQNQLVISK